METSIRKLRKKRWFFLEKSDSVETISMPDVVNVGTNAFKGFGWLESISLPKAETIGSSAFFNCTRMTSVIK